MTLPSVYCLARDRAPADRILHDLKESGFANTGISILFLDRQARAGDFDPDRPVVPAAPSSTDIRGVVGWLDGARSLRLPGVAPLIVAGPLANVFHAALGGGIAGALEAAGLGGPESARLAQRVLGGAFLIAAHSEKPEAIGRAAAIFREEQAEECAVGMSAE